jgi:hypothetical protein
MRFVVLPYFSFLQKIKFGTILTTFMFHSFLSFISSFFRQLANDMLCAPTLPCVSPSPVFRTVYLMLQCFVCPFLYAVDTLHFSSDLSYNFFLGGDIFVAVNKPNVTYSLVSLLIPSCVRGICDWYLAPTLPLPFGKTTFLMLQISFHFPSLLK